MKHNIRMIALDLDGTLFTDDKQITQASFDAIHAAADAGILIVPATGRPVAGIPDSILEIPEVHYVLTSNGARVVKLSARSMDGTFTHEVLYEHLLSKQSALRALKILKKYDTLCEAYYLGQGYAPKHMKDQVQKYHNNPNMWEYFWLTRVFVEDLEQCILSFDGQLDKIQSLFSDMDERKLALEELQMCNEYTLVGSLLYNIEINALNVNKGTSLLILGEQLGISKDEIMALGDGDNDFEMLQCVGVGVAMANAEEHVLQAAKYVTSTNNEDGVAEAIYKYALGL